jgi:hypothetical protein
VRRLTVPASAALLALILAACGGSSHGSPARATTTGSATPTAAATPTGTTRAARARTAPPSPAEIRQAAVRTAAQPGFRARVRASITIPQLNGGALIAAGSGRFDPASDSGTLDLAVQLPGLLGLVGPLPSQVRLVGGEAYVQVPADIAGQLSSSDAWLQESISALGLGTSLRPQDILRELARDATRSVPGQRARVTIDPRGLVRTIDLTYTAAGGYHVRAQLTLTSFDRQPAATPPPPASTGELKSALRALGF